MTQAGFINDNLGHFDTAGGKMLKNGTFLPVLIRSTRLDQFTLDAIIAVRQMKGINTVGQALHPALAALSAASRGV